MAAERKPLAHAKLREAIVRARPRLVALCQELVRIDSQNPPGSTVAIADYIERWFGTRDDVEIKRVIGADAIINLVVRLCGVRPGRSLVFNGHLDTFPIGNAAAWTVPPLSGHLCDSKIFGRGVSDMKAGLAASMIAFEALCDLRHDISGELVLALVGDEETGGKLGTQYLLQHVPEARGDAMLNGDVGSPQVARVGEKGQMWIELRASGRSAHGAHVHLGVNAIERLVEGIQAVLSIARRSPAVPQNILSAITAAQPVSEPLSGEGESTVLRSITANVGTIEGGLAVNLIPDSAACKIDLRFPPGTSCGEVQDMLRAALGEVPNIRLSILSQCEPNWTDPDDEIVRLVCQHASDATGKPVVANMRIGFSDARFYRTIGIPSVTYGPTPFNMGGADEYVLVSDLYAVAEVHALTAYDYLSNSSE